MKTKTVSFYTELYLSTFIQFFPATILGTIGAVKQECAQSLKKKST